MEIYRWSTNRTSHSPTCLQDCYGRKRPKPVCAEVSVSDQKSCILQTVLFLFFLISSQTDFRPFFKKLNDSNVTFPCELSDVPASPEQVFSKKVTNTDNNKIPRLSSTLSPHFRQTWGSVLHHCCLFHCNGLVPMPCLC